MVGEQSKLFDHVGEGGKFVTHTRKRRRSKFNLHFETGYRKGDYLYAKVINHVAH